MARKRKFTDEREYTSRLESDFILLKGMLPDFIKAINQGEIKASRYDKNGHLQIPGTIETLEACSRLLLQMQQLGEDIKPWLALVKEAIVDIEQQLNESSFIDGRMKAQLYNMANLILDHEEEKTNPLSHAESVTLRLNKFKSQQR